MRSRLLRQTPLLATCLGLLLWSSGCTSLRDYVQNGFKVGPNYQQPAVPVADQWIDSTDARLTIGPADDRAWWTVFNDPILDRLIQTTYEQNITLREAGFRVAESQALRNVVVGNLFPQLQQINADYTRIQRGTQTATFPRVDPSSPFASIGLRQFSNWSLGGALSWELDFWGRYRRSIEAADARLDASVEDYDDALVVLISEVASTYVELRTTEQLLEVARENAKLQTESVRIAQARLDVAALNSEVDTPQAKSNLGNTLATIEATEIRRRQVQNRLAVLLGMPPHDLTYIIDGPKPIPIAPETITTGIPSELVWRRPDVRRAERLVAAKSAEIGIAVSNLYPHISINGTIAYEAAQFSDVFKSSAFGGTIGPSLRWDVLNYGRLVNNIRVEDARFHQLTANYQQTVLLANEEAENAIVAFIHFHNQVDVLDESVAQAREAERVSQLKYSAGEIDFNRLFTVQQLLLGQQEALTAARGNLAASLIQLYRALGGGWEIRLDPATETPLELPQPEQTPAVPEVVPAPEPAAPKEGE